MILLALALFLIPGYLLCGLLCRPVDALARFTLAATIGLVGVSWAAFLAAYRIGHAVTPEFLAVVGGVLVVGAVLLRRQHGGTRPAKGPALSPGQPDPLGRPVQLAVAGLALLIGGLSWWNFDHYLFSAGSCVIDTVLGLGNPSPGADTALPAVWFNLHQRMGSISLITPFYALWGSQGFRVLYALVAALDVLLLFQIGRTLTRGWRLALAVALLGAFDPLLVQIPALEENVLAVFVMLAFLAALLHRQRSVESGALAGFLLACVVGVRYIELLALPAMAYYFLRVQPAPRRQRAVAFTAALAVGLLPWAMHNVSGLGSLLAFPSEDTLAAAAGSTAGLPVPRYANWPFFEQMVRTPFNAYPTWLLHPLNFLRNSGLLLSALVVLGLGSWALRPRSVGRFLLLLVAPTLLLLGLLENWIKPNKLGVALVVYPVLMLAVLEALRRLAEPRRRYWIALPCAPVVLVAFVLGLRGLDVPADPRTYDNDEGRWVASEQASAVALEREYYGALQWLPDVAGYSRYSPWLAGWKLADFPLDAQAPVPRCRFHPAVVAPPQRVDGPQRLALRADADWYASQNWLVAAGDGAGAAGAAGVSGDAAGAARDAPRAAGDASAAAPVALPADQPVTWTLERAAFTADRVHVILYRCHAVIYALRLHDNLRSKPVSDEQLVQEGFEFLFLRHHPPDPLTFRRITPPASGVAAFARRDAAALVVLDVLSDTYELAYRWDVPLTGAEIALPAPRRFYMP